ncbi:helix-turn-helix domain-containing protein [Tunturiibacter psychrotolerans]|uniref:helix-turn-helix domain-containing protein n=1 Tax=Tunturiibacter psychrotolerans TaxID=3069686 RepID=UPI003D23B31A
MLARQSITICKLREQRWTQRFAAENAGISSEYLSRVQNGRKEPCSANIAKLGRAFGI